MTIYLCVSLVVIGLLLLMGNPKAALIAGVVAICGGFGYRLYAGEEIRAVVADALFCAFLLPIGWWAEKQFHGIIDSQNTPNSN